MIERAEVYGVYNTSLLHNPGNNAYIKDFQDDNYGLDIVPWVRDEAGDTDLAGCGELLGYQGASGSFMYY